MALNLTTFRTDADLVSDLIEAESDTDAHYATMAAAVKASATTVVELKRLAENCAKLLAAIGKGAEFQPASS
jgi:hypothetical protein